MQCASYIYIWIEGSGRVRAGMRVGIGLKYVVGNSKRVTKNVFFFLKKTNLYHSVKDTE